MSIATYSTYKVSKHRKKPLEEIFSMRSRKAPSFDSYRPSSSAASFAKSRNKAKDTNPELLLRKALWAHGARYRLHVKQLHGKPDMVFARERVIVFIDGDFWHGRNWMELREKLRRRANADYWIAKIQYNRDRDEQQTRALEQEGWMVLRFWETDIAKDIESAVAGVMKALGRAQ